MEIDQKVIYTCTVCGTDFKNWKALERHNKNNVHQHMKQHANSTSSIDEVTEKIEYNPTLNVAALKNMIVGRSNEYKRKVKLGREIKLIIQEIKAPRACLDKEQMEALILFEKHDQDKMIGSQENNVRKGVGEKEG